MSTGKKVDYLVALRVGCGFSSCGGTPIVSTASLKDSSTAHGQRRSARNLLGEGRRRRARTLCGRLQWADVNGALNRSNPQRIACLLAKLLRVEC